MRILITTDAFPPGAGGSGQSTAALAKALARRGHEIAVVASRAWPAGSVERSTTDGIALIEVGVGSAKLGNANRRESHLASFLLGAAEPFGSFDVVHAQHWLSGGATTAAAAELGLPAVVTVRDYWPVCIWSTRLSGDARCPGCTYGRRVVCVGRRYPALWPLAPVLPYPVGRELHHRRESLGRADAVVAVSRFVQAALPVEASTVIPNGIDFAAIEESLAGPVPALPERFVLFVGKLEANKAPDRAIAAVAKARPDLPLLIAGTGRMEPSLREQAKRLNVDARFLGWVSEDMVRILMQRSAALVFPSRWEEPLSRVLLEGLATGAVLIVEPTGGSEEIVADGESGLVARTEEDMVAALQRALAEKSLAERLRRGAVERARERFSIDVVLPQMESLYDKVVAGR